MTIAHDAIAEKVRNFLTTGQIFGIREVMSAYLDLYDEVMRLRADRKQGGLDYCDLMKRHDAHFVAWQSAKSRAEKAEANLHHVIQERDATFALMLARAEAAEAERDALRAAGDRLSVCAQTTGGTAGRDDGLVAAITGWKEARQALKGQTND